MALPICGLLLLTNRHIQQELVSYTTTYFTNLTGAPLTIQNIHYNPFKGIIIENVTLYDTTNNVIAHFDQFVGNISYRRLLKKEVAIKDLYLEGPLFYLTTDAHHKTNLQFLADAFPAQEPAHIGDWVFSVRSIHINNGTFYYNHLPAPYGAKGAFDPLHLCISNLQTSLSLEVLSADTAHLTLHTLSLQEKCGFKLKDLSCQASVGSKASTIRDFALKLPKSTLKFDSLQLGYDSLAQLTHKELVKNAKVAVSLHPSNLYGADFAPLLPQLKGLHKPLSLNGYLQYANHSVKLRNFSAKYGTDIQVKTAAEINGIDNLSDAYIYANIQHIQATKHSIENLIANLQNKPFVLPKELNHLGKIQFNGNITGFFSEIVAYGLLKTDIGNVDLDLLLTHNENTHQLGFSGGVKTERIDLEKLLGAQSKLGTVSANVLVNGEMTKNKRLTGSIRGNVNEFNYNNYRFKDINIDGLYTDQAIMAKVNYQDPNNGCLTADMAFSKHKDSLDLQLSVLADTIKLHGMKLIETYPDLVFSTRINSHLHGKHIDDIVGYFTIDSTYIRNKKGAVSPNKIELTSKIIDNKHYIDFNSGLIQASLEGDIALSCLPQNVQYMIAKELTNLPPLAIEKKEALNDFNFSVQIDPISDYTYLFEQKWSIDDTTYISGYFNDKAEEIELTVQSNLIDFGKNSIDSMAVHIHNFHDSITSHINAIYQSPIDTTYLHVATNVFNNQAKLAIDWENTVESDFSGILKTQIDFAKPQRKDQVIDVTCSLLPSTMLLADSLWHIQPGSIHYNEDELVVNNIWFDGKDQYIKINGKASKQDKSQVIKASLKDIDLQYLSNVLYMPDIKLLGIVTAEAEMGQILHKPILNATASAKQFGLNGYPLGDVIDASATYNYDLEQIDLKGTVLNAVMDTSLVVGYVSPVRNEMLLDIDVNNLDLSFIKTYLSVFANDMAGIGHGKLYVGGDLDAIEIWGNAYVKNAMLSIDFLKSKFYFEDSITIKKNAFILKDIEITDEYGNKGKVDGLVTHNKFNEFVYNIDIAVNNLLAFNTTELNSPDFYGKLYATGNAHILGDMNNVEIDVIAKPEKGSYFAIPLNNYMDATDNNFITYITPKETKLSVNERRIRRKQRISESIMAKMKVNLAIEATPDVEAQIIMDSHTGDIIKARGNGNIKVELDNNLNVKVYGNYKITEGSYDFSMQGALRKRFEVGENSSISFDGDPMNNCNMNINATYQTTASLTDLLESSIMESVKNSTVKTLCIARITGPLMSPSIKFDIQLPDADDEVQRMVKAAINTEDMMSQQMVFLLLTGKFYNPQVTQGNGNYTTQLAASFATATISSQLNYWLSQISNNVNLGLNYYENSADAANNRQITANISTKFFNNRLILNGNVGYRNQYGTEDFIGDFDLEYKLIESGRLRLKAYNKTNDRLYSTALYTQGLGIMYREDFDTWENLYKYYKEVFRKRTPEEKEAQKAKAEKEKLERQKEREAKRLLREDRKRRHKIYVEEQKRIKEEQKRLQDANKREQR
ncbi:MAG: translocation/assembly module TamB domain-containing protein [Paludibacteraceae bacterium]|nr:translocation/assembly module TamB domain-containing protein [Paludibacteraceae bacterium]